jgi:hypothetical protein
MLSVAMREIRGMHVGDDASGEAESSHVVSKAKAGKAKAKSKSRSKSKGQAA